MSMKNKKILLSKMNFIHLFFASVILFLIGICNGITVAEAEQTQPVHSIEYVVYSEKEPTESEVLSEIMDKEKCKESDITIISTKKQKIEYYVGFQYDVIGISGYSNSYVEVDFTQVTDIEGYILNTLQKKYNSSVVITDTDIEKTTYRIDYTLIYESPDYKKSVGEYFNAIYTKKDSKAELSSISLYIQGYRIPYLLEDGGEYYIPESALNDFRDPETIRITDFKNGNPEYEFYNLDYKTAKKAGTVIGKIEKASKEDGLYLINRVAYYKLSEVFDDWRTKLIYSEKEKTFYYGTKPTGAEKKLIKDDIYEFVKESTKNCKTDKDKIKAIHDAIVLKCYYDTKNYSYYNEKLTEKYNMTTSQAMTLHMLIDKTGICENYSRFFKECCDRLFIPCELVSGDAGGGAHMWNRVYTDGKWYHIDVTFADYIGNKYKKSSDIRRTYYLKSAYEFMGHHLWDGDDYVLPEFSKSWSKIDRNNIKTTEDLRKAVVYASYLCREGKKKTYKFKITGSGVQTGVGYYILGYGYVWSVSSEYSKGYLTVTYNNYTY